MAWASCPGERVGRSAWAPARTAIRCASPSSPSAALARTARQLTHDSGNRLGVQRALFLNAARPGLEHARLSGRSVTERSERTDNPLCALRSALSRSRRTGHKSPPEGLIALAPSGSSEVRRMRAVHWTASARVRCLRRRPAGPRDARPKASQAPEAVRDESARGPTRAVASSARNA